MAELTPEQKKALAVARARAKLNAEMSFDGSHPRQIEDDARGAAGAFLRTGLPQGLTLGAADEIQSFATGEDVDAIRARNAEREAAYPTAVQAGQMTGAGMASVVPIGGALSLTGGLPLAVRMGAGAVAGGGTAALEGFLSGEGHVNEPDSTRLDEAMNPGALMWGAGLGSAAPAAGAAIGRIAGALTKRAAPATVAAGIDPMAGRLAARSFRDDAAFLDDANAYLDRLGQEGMIADLGHNTRLQAQGLAVTPGPGAQNMVRAVEERHAGQAGRVNADIDQALGDPQNLVRTQEALADNRRTVANAQYGQFNQTMVPMDDDLRAMLAHADRAGALKDARDLASAEDFTFRAEDYLNPETTEIEGRALDIISRSLRDKAEAEARAGRGGISSALRDLDERFLERIPALRGIRKQYKEDSLVMKAAEKGQDLFNSKVSADQFRSAWQNMSEREKAAFRLAARSELENKMAGAVHEGRVGMNAIGSRASQEKIRIAFGDQAQDILSRRLDAEPVFSETRSKVSQGAQTAARQSAKAELLDLTDETGQRRGPLGRLKQAGGDMGNLVVDALLGRVPRDTAVDLSKVLSATGAERDRIVQALLADMGQYVKADQREALAAQIAQQLLAGGTGAVISQQ